MAVYKDAIQTIQSLLQKFLPVFQLKSNLFHFFLIAFQCETICVSFKKTVQLCLFARITLKINSVINMKPRARYEQQFCFVSKKSYFESRPIPLAVVLESLSSFTFISSCSLFVRGVLKACRFASEVNKYKGTI